MSTKRSQLSWGLWAQSPNLCRHVGRLAQTSPPSLTFRLRQGWSCCLEHPSLLCSPGHRLFIFQPAVRRRPPCPTPWQGGLVARVLLPYPKHPDLSRPVTALLRGLQALLGGLVPPGGLWARGGKDQSCQTTAGSTRTGPRSRESCLVVVSTGPVPGALTAGLWVTAGCETPDVTTGAPGARRTPRSPNMPFITRMGIHVSLRRDKQLHLGRSR